MKKSVKLLICMLTVTMLTALCVCATEEKRTRPSFVKQDSMFVGVIKEDTVEEAIAAIDIAEEKGAMGLDLHLTYLHDSGTLTEENLGKICRSTTLPILAINYNSDISQEERLAELLLAAQAGCAAIDLPGFMFWSGSTANTHTAENVAYWENLGYGMSFIAASPAETVIDPETVEQQKAYVKRIQDLGAEVLMSCHVKTVFTAEEAVEFIRFHAMKGVDVVKVVGYGYTKEDVAACVEACKTLREDATLSAKFSYHLSGGVGGQITRVLCPVFYGSYVAFCYPELTERQDANQLDLDMAIEALAAGKDADKDISIADAIVRLQQASTHAQLAEIIRKYENCETIGKAYASTSDYSKRWSFDGDTYRLLMRNATGTSSFNLRGYAYDSKHTQTKNVYVSASVTGDFTPHVSDTRVPKVGVYIGTEEKMLALVYNTNAKTVDLVYNPQYTFTFDKEIKRDVLVSTGLVTPKTFAAAVSAGESISLGMHLTKDTLDLYAGADRLAKIASVPVTEEPLTYMQKNADGTYNAGVLSEVYMGNASKGRENSVTFTDVSYRLAGDADGDGVLSVADALLVIGMMLEGEYTVTADVNNDGKLTVPDVLFLLKAIV